MTWIFPEVRDLGENPLYLRLAGVRFRRRRRHRRRPPEFRGGFLSVNWTSLIPPLGIVLLFYMIGQVELWRMKMFYAPNVMRSHEFVELTADLALFCLLPPTMLCLALLPMRLAGAGSATALKRFRLNFIREGWGADFALGGIGPQDIDSALLALMARRSKRTILSAGGIYAGARGLVRFFGANPFGGPGSAPTEWTILLEEFAAGTFMGLIPVATIFPWLMSFALVHLGFLLWECELRLAGRRRAGLIRAVTESLFYFGIHLLAGAYFAGGTLILRLLPDYGGVDIPGGLDALPPWQTSLIVFGSASAAVILPLSWMTLRHARRLVARYHGAYGRLLFEELRSG